MDCCWIFYLYLLLCFANLFEISIKFAQRGKNDIIPLCVVLLNWLFSQQRVSFDRGENSYGVKIRVVQEGLSIVILIDYSWFNKFVKPAKFFYSLYVYF